MERDDSWFAADLARVEDEVPFSSPPLEADDVPADNISPISPVALQSTHASSETEARSIDHRLPAEVMRRVMIWLGSTTATTMLMLQLVCRAWLAAADKEMWRNLLLSLCGRDMVNLAAKLNDVRMSASQQNTHKDMCLNLAFFGDEAIVFDIGRGYSKYGRADLDALSCPAPEVLQLCQPNADCDRSELLECVEGMLESCDLTTTTLVLVVPFAMSGLDHYTIRANFLERVLATTHCQVMPKSVYFVESAPCVLLAYGLVTGVVCSIGFGETFIVPVAKGRVISSGVLRSNLGGMALTQYMQQLVMNEVDDAIDWERLQDAIDIPLITFCRNLKVHCHVSPTPDPSSGAACTHRIPAYDDVVMEITSSLHECPELLFQGEAGLGGMVWEAVQAASGSDIELQDELLSSIVLNGGSAQMAGLAERLRYEVCTRLPADSDLTKVNVLGGERGDNAPWQGAVRFALANNCIRQRTSIPQCLLMHQCAAQGCIAHETADGNALKICSRCKKVRYCSLEHQKAHWKEHKEECGKCAQ